jgi:hypothetical protein
MRFQPFSANYSRFRGEDLIDELTFGSCYQRVRQELFWALRKINFSFSLFQMSSFNRFSSGNALHNFASLEFSIGTVTCAGYLSWIQTADSIFHLFDNKDFANLSKAAPKASNDTLWPLHRVVVTEQENGMTISTTLSAWNTIRVFIY